MLGDKLAHGTRVKKDDRVLVFFAGHGVTRRLPSGKSLGYHEDALKDFEESARLNPRSALFANNVGFAYYKLQRLDEAVTWFQKTLALDPQRAVAAVNLGDALVALGRRDEARKAYERYLELQPATRTAEYVRRKLAELAAPPP